MHSSNDFPIRCFATMTGGLARCIFGILQSPALWASSAGKRNDTAVVPMWAFAQDKGIWNFFSICKGVMGMLHLIISESLLSQLIKDSFPERMVHATMYGCSFAAGCQHLGCPMSAATHAQHGRRRGYGLASQAAAARAGSCERRPYRANWHRRQPAGCVARLAID